MKKLLLPFIFFGFTIGVFAQNTLVVSLKIQCQGTQTEIEIYRDTLETGQKFIAPETTLPANMSAAQPLYDAFAGAELDFPVDMVSEDLFLEIVLNGIDCSAGTYEDLELNNGEVISFLMRMDVRVYDINKIDRLNQGQDYVLNNPVKLKMEKDAQYATFLTIMGITGNPEVLFVFLNNGVLNQLGIETIDTDSTWIAEISHYQL